MCWTFMMIVHSKKERVLWDKKKHMWHKEEWLSVFFPQTKLKKFNSDGPDSWANYYYDVR